MSRLVNTKNGNIGLDWLDQIASGMSRRGNMMVAGHIFARETFLLFLDFEIKRARRYQNFFSVVRFELSGGGGGAGSQTKSLKSLVKLLRGEVRETDVLGQTKKNEIMIILPYCDSSGADVVNTRLNGLIRDFHFGKEEFKIDSGLVCFPVEATDMTEILNRLNTSPQSSPLEGMN